jgi:hypothetical protein
MEGSTMSLTSPPGHGKQLTQLLAFIVDDDDRTRRAILLLRASAWLLPIGAIVPIVLAADGLGRYATAAGSTVVLLLTQAARARRKGRNR